MARCRGKFPSPMANDSNVPATSRDYYFDVDGKADVNLADLEAADEPLIHTVLMARVTELQEECSRADVAVPSIVDVVNFVLERFSAPTAGDVSSTDALRRTGRESKLQV